jgi:hypothetical protein
VKRVLVVVEEQTERAFVKDVLATTFWPRQIYMSAVVLGQRKHKGGRPTYARLRPDIISQLKQDCNAYCSTMLDFYGLGGDFPGKPLPTGLSSIQKVERIEQVIKQDICRQIPDAEVRFIPYLQLHEYEALLFSDTAAFARAIKKQGLEHQLKNVRDSFATPEDIDDGSNTAPSKRVQGIYPPYKKVIEGTLAAQAVGIDAMRQECPHFRNWLERLEAIRTTS